MDEQDHSSQPEHISGEEQVDVIDDQDVLEIVEEGDAQSLENGVQVDLEDLDMSGVVDMGSDDGGDMALLVDDAVMCFEGHTGSVFSVSVQSSAGELACSGGEDDKAYVWRVSDGSVLFECDGHKDSVLCTGFSGDGKYVATADMGGLIQVWTVPDGKRVWSFETGDLEWLQWHPQAHVLLVGTSSGEAWMWKIPSGDCKTFQGHNSRNTCAAILKTGKSGCFGYEDGSIKVWDLKEGSPLLTVMGGQGHTSAVTCMTAHKDSNLLLSGSDDSTAKLTNVNSGKVVATFPAGFPRSDGASSAPATPESEEEKEREPVCVEAVGFSPVLPVALTGSLSGVLGVWDLPTQQLRLQCPHEAGVVRIYCSENSPVVYTGCLDAVLRRWDIRTGQCVREWQGHSDHILDMTFTRDEKLLLTSSDDQTVRVFST